MPVRVLVQGAGTGASNNLVRSLKASDPSPVVVGCHHDPFVLRKSSADRRYLVLPTSHPHFVDGFRRVIETEKVDLLIPNTDAEVGLASRLRDQLPCRVFLPPPDVVELCQNKYALATFLQARGVAVPATYPVTERAEIDAIFERFAPSTTLWCRVRTGTGSVGALPVRTPAQARAWIDYWEEMREVPATAFTISEYLPGRDFACQMLWQRGRLVLAKTVERLSYFGGARHPSGVSSVAALAKTVRDPRVLEVCVAAVAALAPRISGAFSADLKESADGVPCITEINVGRFITMLNLFDFTGRHSMTATYVRLALGEPDEIADAYDAAEDWYFMRDVDTVPLVCHADEVFEGMEDVRS